MKKNKWMFNFLNRIIQNDYMFPSHISMYVVFIQIYKNNKFQNPFHICREEVMKLSKIKSIVTYHKCIKDLNTAGYIIYSPNFNPYARSTVQLNDLSIESKVINQGKKSYEENIIYTKPDITEVKLYFEERDLSNVYAINFYMHYQNINWRKCNGEPIKSWQAAARNWIKKQFMER